MHMTTMKEEIGDGIVSFKLDKIAEEMKTAKGLKIRVNTIYDNVIYKKIDLEKQSKSSQIPTANQLKPMSYTTGTNY